jgi:hypothetical protein
MQLLSWLSVVLAIISLAIQLDDRRRPQPTLPSVAARPGDLKIMRQNYASNYASDA